jgi:hypothetical protein
MRDEERGTEQPVAWGVWVRIATSGGRGWLLRGLVKVHQRLLGSLGGLGLRLGLGFGCGLGCLG